MSRDLDWDGCVNVRDLGGFTTPSGTTAFGVLVRADNARKLTPAGWRAASEYGIRTVLDLRSDPECAADPPAHPGFAHRRISLFDHFDGDAAYRADLLARAASLDNAEKHRLLYREALELDTARFAEAVGVLADADGAVLFHCAGGKDRTGVLTALLLRLAGVPLEEVEADYVASQARLKQGPEAHLHDTSTPPDVINRVLGELEARYGTATSYLIEAGMPAERLDRLRSRLQSPPNI
ncbi:MAG: protein-tyrosine phosphatase [Gaiellaceae bacterium]|nr:protein-tyrosine phosphatase [Gaiellaceae bacterium]